MDDLVLMEIFETDDQIGYKEFGFYFRKPSFFADVVTQISTCQVVHDEVKLLSVLKSKMDIH